MPQILIADDDPLLSEIVRWKLELAGHHVRVVTDGEAALAEVRRNPPSLVVLDSMMPLLSGPEVLRELKADESMRAVPVMMLTARKEQSEIVDALRGGAADYLTKPFLPDELVTRVAMVLARSTAEQGRAHAA